MRRGCAATPSEPVGEFVRLRGHLLMITGETLRWCLRCACYTEYTVRHLARAECTGHPTQPARWKRLVQGLHPTVHSRGYVGDPRRVEWHEWTTWAARNAPHELQAEIVQAEEAGLLEEEAAVAALHVAPDEAAAPVVVISAAMRSIEEDAPPAAWEPPCDASLWQPFSGIPSMAAQVGWRIDRQHHP